MARFPEAEIRMFRNIFVCKRCKTKIRSPNVKITAGTVKCRRCNSKAFRSVRRK